MTYYVTKVNQTENKSYILGKYDKKSLAIDAMFKMLQDIEKKNRQIIIDRDDIDAKACVYRKTGLIWVCKELIEYYQVIEFPTSELTKAVKSSKIPPLTLDKI